MAAPAGKQPRSTQPQLTRNRVEDILARREQLMADLSRLRQEGEGARFADNARKLLTRWWSTNNWHSREELLRSAEWLIRVAQRHEHGNHAPA